MRGIQEATSSSSQSLSGEILNKHSLVSLLSNSFSVLTKDASSERRSLTEVILIIESNSDNLFGIFLLFADCFFREFY